MSTKVMSFNDTEIGFNESLWKVIYLNGEQTNYCINKDGLVYNYRRKSYKKHILNEGYTAVQLSHKSKSYMCRLHRLLALAFIPNTHNLECVDHVDGNKQNYSLENLEWVSKAENTKRAYDINLSKPKSKQYSLMKDGVVYTGENLTHFAKSLGLNQANLNRVMTGKAKSAYGFTKY